MRGLDHVGCFVVKTDVSSRPTSETKCFFDGHFLVSLAPFRQDSGPQNLLQDLVREVWHLFRCVFLGVGCMCFFCLRKGLMFEAEGWTNIDSNFRCFFVL